MYFCKVSQKQSTQYNAIYHKMSDLFIKIMNGFSLIQRDRGGRSHNGMAHGRGILTPWSLTTRFRFPDKNSTNATCFTKTQRQWQPLLYYHIQYTITVLYMNSMIHHSQKERDINVLRVTRLSGGHFTLILDVTQHI